MALDKATIEKVKKGEMKIGEAFNVTAEQYGSILLAGHTLFSEGRFEEAKQVFEGLAALDAKNPYVHGILGAIYQKEGKNDVAVLRYSLALSLHPGDINSLANRGEILLSAGKYKEAAADLKKAIELDPNRKHPGANRARLLVAMTQEALKLAQEKGVQAVRDARKRIDAQLQANA